METRLQISKCKEARRGGGERGGRGGGWVGILQENLVFRKTDRCEGSMQGSVFIKLSGRALIWGHCWYEKGDPLLVDNHLSSFGVVPMVISLCWNMWSSIYRFMANNAHTAIWFCRLDLSSFLGTENWPWGNDREVSSLSHLEAKAWYLSSAGFGVACNAKQTRHEYQLKTGPDLELGMARLYLTPQGVEQQTAAQKVTGLKPQLDHTPRP